MPRTQEFSKTVMKQRLFLSKLLWRDRNTSCWEGCHYRIMASQKPRALTAQIANLSRNRFEKSWQPILCYRHGGLLSLLSLCGLFCWWWFLFVCFSGSELLSLPYLTQHRISKIMLFTEDLLRVLMKREDASLLGYFHYHYYCQPF